MIRQFKKSVVSFQIYDELRGIVASSKQRVSSYAVVLPTKINS